MDFVFACVAEHATVQASDGGDVCTKRPFEAQNFFTLHEVLLYVTVMSSVRNSNLLNLQVAACIVGACVVVLGSAADLSIKRPTRDIPVTLLWHPRDILWP